MTQNRPASGLALQKQLPDNMRGDDRTQMCRESEPVLPPWGLHIDFFLFPLMDYQI